MTADSISWLLDSTKNLSYTEQLQSAQRALLYANDIDLQEKAAKAHIRIGTVLSFQGKHKEALEQFNIAENLIEENNFRNLKSLFYLKKSGVLLWLNQLEEAITFNLEAADWFSEVKDTIDLGLTYGNIGAFHFQLGNLKEAKDYLELGLKTLEGTELENDGMILSNLAGIYLAEGSPKKAIPLFESYLEEARRTNSKIHEVAILTNLASANGVAANYSIAFDYYDQAIKLAESEDFPDAKYKALQLMSYTYELKGDFEKSLQTYKEYEALKEEVIGKKTQTEIADLQVKYETDAKEKELLALKQEGKDRLLRLGLIITVLALLLVIGLLIFLKRTSDYKKNKALYASEQKLLETELQNKTLREEQLQDRLEYQQKDLTNLTLDITRKNEFSQELLIQLDTLSKNLGSDAQKKLHDIKLFVSGNIRINEELEVFQKNIKEVNQDFYRKLSEKFPSLTTKDTELCGLIKLNRSNKEIAVLRNISVSSAKMNRYRLRKKLKLKPEDDIVKFLRNIT